MGLKKHKLSLSQEEFLKRMNNIFGELYDFSEEEVNKRLKEIFT